MKAKKCVVMVVAFAVAMMLTASAANAQTTKAEKDALIKLLKQSKDDLHKTVKGLNEEQLKWKPAPERWSVRECVEHLALAEDFLKQLIHEKVMVAPAAPGKKTAAQIKEGDDMLYQRIPDRSQKAQAPEPTRPGGTTNWNNFKDVLSSFDTRRKATIEEVKSSKEDLRAHMMDSPIVKEMDAYQWYLLIALHTQRHTAQAKEVIATAGFPEK